MSARRNNELGAKITIMKKIFETVSWKFDWNGDFLV
jgi:hypothetical protein